MILREPLNGAEERLSSGPHPERARLDAEGLLLHWLHIEGENRNRAWLHIHASDSADVAALPVLESLVSRRVAGEPMQYILGECDFFGLPFIVTPDVLIPRPETEHLVEEVIRLARSFPQDRRLEIADIGTGSGAIAVALAVALPHAHVVATDLSRNALTIAERNAERNGVAERVEFIEGDLLSPLAERRFSIIVSNPPYVPLDDRDSLSVEVRDYEPHGALFAGSDGLDVYRRLIPAARNSLVADGWLVLEIGCGQQSALEAMLVSEGYHSVAFAEDYQGIPRVAYARTSVASLPHPKE